MKINQCVLNKSSLYFVLQDPFEAKRNPDHMKDPTWSNEVVSRLLRHN